jgi:acyl carrier protein|tara:strand:- start:237 stop:479 length:243 start_codon:yes stop_codon:yes gene_type:complete
MSIKILRKKLLQIISKEIKIDINKLDLNKSANDFVEWDSLSNVRLILRIQKEFKINISFGETIALNDINDLLQFIMLKLK